MVKSFFDIVAPGRAVQSRSWSRTGTSSACVRLATRMRSRRPRRQPGWRASMKPRAGTQRKLDHIATREDRHSSRVTPGTNATGERSASTTASSGNAKPADR